MAEWTDWADGNDLAKLSRGTDPLASMGYDPDELRIDASKRADAMGRVGGTMVAQNQAPPNPAKQVEDSRTAVPDGEPPNPTLKQRPTAQPQAQQRPAAPQQPVPDTVGSPTSPAVAPSGNGAPQGSPDWQGMAGHAVQGQLDIADEARRVYASQPEAPDTTGIDTRIEAESIPTNPRDVDPVTGKPLYKPSFKDRLERGVAAFGKGGIPGVLNPGAAGATPYGAPNKDFQEDEQLRQGMLANDQQKKTDTLARFKALTDAATGRAKNLQTVGKDYGEAATSANTAQERATQIKTEQRQQDDNSPEHKAAISDAEYNQRVKQADRSGLRGNLRSIYLLNGKVPDPHQPTAEEIARGQAIEVFRRQNGRPPATLDEINQVNAAASGRLKEGTTDDSAVSAIVADATGKKNEFLANWERQKDGSYLRRGARPFSTDKADKMTGEAYNAKVDQFRLDANKELDKHGASIDATGTVQKRTAAPNPAAPSPDSPPPGATHVYKDKHGKVKGYAVNGQFVPVTGG